MYQKLIIAGRLGRDAELRTLSGDNQVIRFSIPITRRGRDDKEETLWVECNYFRGANDSTEILKYLCKGAIVLMEGTPWLRQYIRNDNTPGVAFECRVNNIKIIAYAPRTDGLPAASGLSSDAMPDDPASIQTDTGVTTDDMPF